MRDPPENPLGQRIDRFVPDRRRRDVVILTRIRLMPASLGPMILKALRLANGAALSAVLIGALGGYYFWPGLLAYLSIGVALLGLWATFLLTNLLGRIRLLMWLIPYADRLKEGLGRPREAPQARSEATPRKTA